MISPRELMSVSNTREHIIDIIEQVVGTIPLLSNSRANHIDMTICDTLVPLLSDNRLISYLIEKSIVLTFEQFRKANEAFIFSFLFDSMAHQEQWTEAPLPLICFIIIYVLVDDIIDRSIPNESSVSEGLIDPIPIDNNGLNDPNTTGPVIPNRVLNLNSLNDPNTTGPAIPNRTLSLNDLNDPNTTGPVNSKRTLSLDGPTGNGAIRTMELIMELLVHYPNKNRELLEDKMPSVLELIDTIISMTGTDIIPYLVSMIDTEIVSQGIQRSIDSDIDSLATSCIMKGRDTMYLIRLLMGREVRDEDEIIGTMVQLIDDMIDIGEDIELGIRTTETEGMKKNGNLDNTIVTIVMLFSYLPEQYGRALDITLFYIYNKIDTNILSREIRETMSSLGWKGLLFSDMFMEDAYKLYMREIKDGL